MKYWLAYMLSGKMSGKLLPIVDMSGHLVMKSDMLWRINEFFYLSEGIADIAIDPVTVIKATKQADRVTTKDIGAGLQQPVTA